MRVHYDRRDPSCGQAPTGPPGGAPAAPCAPKGGSRAAETRRHPSDGPSSSWVPECGSPRAGERRPVSPAASGCCSGACSAFRRPPGVLQCSHCFLGGRWTWGQEGLRCRRCQRHAGVVVVTPGPTAAASCASASLPRLAPSSPSPLAAAQGRSRAQPPSLAPAPAPVLILAAVGPCWVQDAPLDAYRQESDAETRQLRSMLDEVGRHPCHSLLPMRGLGAGQHPGCSPGGGSVTGWPGSSSLLRPARQQAAPGAPDQAGLPPA